MTNANEQDLATDGLGGDPNAGFGARVKSAVLWRSGSQIVAQLVMWAATLAVIRILNPADYGVFAMTQVVLAFLAFLNGYGFASSLIQSESVEAIRIRQAFGLLIVMNAGIALIQFLLAPLVAAYYREPMVTELLRWQILIFLANPFMIVPEVMLSRTLEFRKQAIVNLVASLASAVTALSCALSGLGIWTLVVTPIVLFWTRAIGMLVATRLIVWPSFDFRGTGAMVGFGSAMLASHFFWTIQTQADVFIGGRVLDPHALGLYAEALFLAQIFAAKFVPPLNEVAFPAYSRLQKDAAAMAEAFLKAVRLIMLIACPIYFGMLAVAEPMVGTLFGEKWMAMAPFIRIIALAMPFMTLQILFAPAVNAKGRPGVTLRCSIFGAILMPATYLVGVQFGAIGLAWGWVFAFPLLTAFTVAQGHRIIGISIAGLLRAVAPALGAAVAMAALVIALDRFALASWGEVGTWLYAARLALLVALGGMAYALLLRIFSPEALMEAIRLVVKRKPPTESVGAPISEAR